MSCGFLKSVKGLEIKCFNKCEKQLIQSTLFITHCGSFSPPFTQLRLLRAVRKDGDAFGKVRGGPAVAPAFGAPRPTPALYASQGRAKPLGDGASVLLVPSLVFLGSHHGSICHRAGVLSHCWKELCNKMS